MKHYHILIIALLTLNTMFLSSCGSSASEESDGDDGNKCLCAEGEMCDEAGNCVKHCFDDTDCAAGYYCDTKQGYCTAVFVDGDIDEETWYEFDIPEDNEFGFESEQEYDVVWETDVEHSTNNPWIKAEPTRINFGAVPQGGSAERDVVISNLGNAKLEVSDMFLWDESQELSFSSDELPITINKNQTSTVKVSYFALDNNPDENLLVISSNDPTTPNISIEIKTDVKAFAKLTFEPNPIDFGIVRMGRNEIQCTITNSGGTRLKVFSLELDPATSTGFGLGNLPQLYISPDNPLYLDVEESATFTLYHESEEELTAETELVISSSDEENGVIAVPVTIEVAEPEIEVTPEELDFAGVDITETLERDCTVKNIGSYPLTISKFEFGAVTDDYEFTVAPPTTPLTLEQNEEVSVSILYSPDEIAPDFGSLVIDSDDADEDHIIVQFINDGSPPDIQATPQTLQFGPQQADTSVIKTIQILNAGGRLLIIDDYVLETEGTIFYKANVPGDLLGGGQSTVVKIGYHPDDYNADEGRLTIFSNDADTPELIVPLAGDGLSLNMIPVAIAGEDGQAAPLEMVQLDGSASYDNDGTVDAYFWTVLDQPAGSHSIPVRPTDAEPFIFFDLVGTYLIQLTVTDNESNVSLPDIVEYTVRPDEKIHIQLLWDKDTVDLDLHMVRPGGELWNGYAHGTSYPVAYTDCFFSTCKKEFEPSGNPVNWNDLGHPSLDLDDKNGYGPENINIDDPYKSGLGDYDVYVHYWDSKYVSDPTTTVTLRIYVLGEKELEITKTFTAEHQLWRVAGVRWLEDDTGYILDYDDDLVMDSHGQ